MEGAHVHAFAPAAWQAWATTDAAGAFLLKNTTPPLTGGPEAMARTHVVVHVRAQDHPRAWGAIRAPGPGEEAPLRIVLERARRLTGRVRMADGTQPPSGRVLLTLMDLGTREHYASTPTVHGHIDASGTFAFADVPAGPLELLLYLGTSWEKTVTVEIPVEGEPEVVDIVLGDGVALTVRVLDAAGDPVPGARVYAVREDLESLYGDPSFGIGPVTGEDGRAVLKNTASVPTWVVVDAPGYGMEVRLVDPATAPAELDVRLGDGVIEGVALHPDGRPARVPVRLTRRIRLARHSTSIPSRATRVETDAEGRFRFEGVGGGDYGIDVEDSEARLLSFGVRLHAGDMDTRLVVATTAEASKLHVEALLLDAETSEPLESDDGLYVSIHPEGGRGSAMMERLSEPAGVYRSTEAHAPGTHTVRVRGKGWGSAEAVVTLRWGAETPRPRIHLARSD